MKPKDELERAAILGRIADDMTKDQISEVDLSRLEPVAIQIGGAHICVQNAIDELEKIPNTSGWLVGFFLRMIAIQLAGYEKQLRKGE